MGFGTLNYSIQGKYLPFSSLQNLVVLVLTIASYYITVIGLYDLGLPLEHF